MPTATRKCAHCRTRFRRESGIVQGLLAWCSEDHRIQWAVQAGRKLRERHIDDKIKAMGKNYYANDIKTRKAAAVREFNAYIRARDAGLPCISCGKPIPPGDYCAGHYIPAGSNSLLRFDEHNVNGQHNTDCNKHRSGDQVRYRKGLLAKYGETVVDRLENTSGTIKRTAADYKAIEVKYRDKRIQLERARAA